MKKLLGLFTPLTIATLSLLVLTVFLRYYLYINSGQLIREFQKQNFREIYSMDTLKVSARLNSLSSVINWVCLEASVANNTFYKMERGSCTTGVIQQKQSILIPQANNTIITFTTRLPKEVEYLFGLFLLMQAILISALIVSTKKSEQEKRQGEIQINKLARQMSHDIRSPLATLNTILSELESLKGEEKTLITKSITRINDISNNLLKNTRNNSSSFSSTHQLPKIVNTNLSSLINELVSEKRSEFQFKSNISLTLEIKDPDLYSSVDELELKRILSNLINNSLEAGSTHTQLQVFRREGRAIIQIKDNGKGIPQTVIEKIGKVEITTKRDGNGLGLMHAFETLSTWAAEMKIEPNATGGTLIELALPANVSKKLITLLLDDDELVRLTWKSTAKKKGVDFLAFEKAEDMLAFTKEISPSSPIYIDSELGDNTKGEDIAYQLHQQGFSNLIMASGHDETHFSHLTFLSGVISKAPPWS